MTLYNMTLQFQLAYKNLCRLTATVVSRNFGTLIPNNVIVSRTSNICAVCRCHLSRLTLCHARSRWHKPVILKRFYSPTPYDDILEDPDIKEEREYPVYETVNIQLKGYDFAVLEKYQSYVHKLCRKLSIDVKDGWATPAVAYKVTKFKPDTVIVDEEFELNLYERNVQLSNLPGVLVPLLTEVVQSSVPAGVRVTIKQHSEEDVEVRYMPDVRMRELLAERDEIHERIRKLN